MVPSALSDADHSEPDLYDSSDRDPPPTTPFEVVAQNGLARLRHYAPVTEAAGRLPVLLVYSLFKRPFILDLDAERSVVQSLLAGGLNVYLLDWQAPRARDAGRGLQSYVNEDIAHTVDCIREREQVERVSLVGICFGGLLSTIYAATRPESVGHLVPVAAGIERRQIIAPFVIEQILQMHGNVPSWWIRNAVNSGVPGPWMLPQYIAAELAEPELADTNDKAATRLRDRLIQWINSDRPFAGHLAREIMRDIYWDGRLTRGKLKIDGRVAALDRIRCPVLNVAGANDQLVPPEYSTPLIDYVSSPYARNFVFPASHIGLLAGRAAHEQLWPRLRGWLKIVD